jgi:Cytochrome P460
MTKRFLPLFYIVILVAVLAFAALNQIVPSEQIIFVPTGNMTLPPNYKNDFTRYMVIDRIDATVRFLYVRPNVLAIIEAGEPLPFGAQIIIETYQAQTDSQGNVLRGENGRLIAGEMFPNVHMMEKRDDWTVEQLPSPVGAIDWNFVSFVGETGLRSDENRNDCMACHDSGAFRRDLLFSRPVLDRFKLTDDLQYLFCNRPERGNCIP